METTEEVKERIILHFTYSLKPGITTFKKYGLCAARAVLPKDVVEYAEQLYNKIEPPKDVSNCKYYIFCLLYYN